MHCSDTDALHVRNRPSKSRFVNIDTLQAVVASPDEKQGFTKREAGAGRHARRGLVDGAMAHRFVAIRGGGGAVRVLAAPRVGANPGTPGRTRTGMPVKARDFKSRVSDQFSPPGHRCIVAAAARASWYAACPSARNRSQGASDGLALHQLHARWLP